VREGAFAPKVLVTGFGPFPGAPENPTDPLVRALAAEPAEDLGAATLKAVVLPVDYRKSWPVLRRLYSSFGPDIVVHFGLSRNAQGFVVERRGSRRVQADRPDAAGFAPPSGVARRSGPDSLPASLPAEAIVGALREAGIPAEASDEAGGYVCDATLYRSLQAASARPERLVGFIHVPPEGTRGLTRERLGKAAAIVVRTAASLWLTATRPPGSN
jgi:pyroglutamyl-peptidase